MENHDTTRQSESPGWSFSTLADVWDDKIRAMIAAAFGAALTVTGLVCVPMAGATPGQCWSSPFGGFCDQFHALRADRIWFLVVPQLLSGVLGRRRPAVPHGLPVRHTLLGGEIDLQRDAVTGLPLRHEYRWAGIIFDARGF